ncbi:MAG: J domain-containing protein [Planctomycetaceae bacterium]|nr:J domain-containing protein [Planctomycetaceae bacterium]
MAKQDYYQTLGVSRSATQDEIRKAFKKIARENHPDVKPDDKAAAQRFKDAAEAYDVLGDEEKRKKYDQFGANWKHFKDGAGPQPGGGGGYYGPDPFRQGGPVDIDLQDLFGGSGVVDLGDLLGGMFGGGRARHRAARGQDVTTSIQVPFHTAAEGGNYDLTLSRGGKTETLSVKIPAGMEDGKAIRLGGQGEPGMGGGPAGDLLVTIKVAAHPYFQRDGQNLLVEVPVSITEAALGAKIDVPTLNEGLLTMTLPPGTSSGAKLRLKGKGLPHPRTGQRGDELVQIKIIPPKDLDDRSREILQEFAERNPEDPRVGFYS